MCRGNVKWGLSLLGVLLSAVAAHAQEARPPRLIDGRPFDVITLDKANDGKVIPVEPLNLPGRKAPEKPRAADKVRIKLLEGGEQYDVAWLNIEKLELFEQLVLGEVGTLITAGRFDDAFDELEFLFSFYPETPGLNEARQNFLYASSGAAFRQGKHEEALAVMEELLAVNPDYRPASGPGPRQSLGSIAERVIGRHIEREDFQSARMLVARLARQYQAENEPFVQRMRQRMIDLATQARNEAEAHLAAGRFAQARDATARMQNIWPELLGTNELLARLALEYPQIRVGVEHPALSHDSVSLHNVAARRAGRLTERLVSEFAGPGPEGGRYLSPLGSFARSDDGRELLTRLGSGGEASGFALLQALLRRANDRGPLFHAAWSRAVSAVRLRSPQEVVVRFQVPQLLPEALVQFPLAELGVASAPYTVLSRDAGAARFAVNPEYAFRGPRQPAELVERWFDDPQLALAALERGEVELLDRIFPADIATLQSNKQLLVGTYSTPTTHLLAVRSNHVYLANSTFRRALLYGSNRELLLTQGLLGGRPLPGFRVISSPFPAPASRNDTSAYGYDTQIEPRSYDPRLGLTLQLLAAGELKAQYEKQKQPAPEMTPIRLGHPADEMSRIACRGLVKQWKQIGVECERVEFAPGVFDDADQPCDLVYLQLAAVEPLLDARRLLGPEGLAPANNPTIQLTLLQLEQSRNWQQARERLLLLHRLLHEDVTLLPLWQTQDHFACRRSVQGLAAPRTRLYQDIEQWQLAPALAGTQP
jgi:tetratricopeptide (TPR) repeat protein